MNETLISMKDMKRAMVSYVLCLYEIVFESNAQDVLEIGVRQAQSTRTMLSALHEKGSGKLVSIDLRDRTPRINQEFLPFFEMVVGNSHLPETIAKVNGKQYDILFIDGDHTYEGVKNDFEMYLPLVKPGGLILMHDICNENEGVEKFWGEIMLPKVGLNYGRAAAGIVPGFGIVQVPKLEI